MWIHLLTLRLIDGAGGNPGVSGSSSTTNANDTLSASGAPTVNGAIARQNTNDTLAASGAAGAVTGSIAATNANDTLTADGSTPQSGPTPAGSWDDDKPRKKKHRWLVEVGNTVYEVRSRQEAIALMDGLQEREAPKIAEKSRTQVKKPRARIISAPKQVAKSKIEATDDGEITRILLERIKAWNATVDAIVRHAAEMDDEEALLMLL